MRTQKHRALGSWTCSYRGSYLGILALAAFAFPNLGSASELQALVGPDANSQDRFGEAVSISGDIVLVGAPGDSDEITRTGAAHLFDANNGEYLRSLEPGDFQAFLEFGHAVAIDGNFALVGAPGANDLGPFTGAVYLFDVASGNLIRRIVAPGAMAGDRFGTAVALRGNLIVVGAPRKSVADVEVGAVYLFDALTGELRTRFEAFDGEAFDRFGSSLSVDGPLLVVGAPQNDERGNNAGAAYLFDVDAEAELDKLLPNPTSDGALFGTSVGISAGNIVIGSPGYSEGTTLGVGAVYQLDAESGDVLRQILLHPREAGDFFGESVDIEGPLIAASAPGRAEPFSESGLVVSIDVLIGRVVSRLVPLSPGLGDRHGTSVALAGGVIAAGAPFADHQEPAAGSVRLFDGDGQPGLRYCFGDGSAAECPCENPGDAGEGCAHGLGYGAQLFSGGSLSVSQGDFLLRGRQLPPNTWSLFFAGTIPVGFGQGQVFGNGLRCAGGSIVHLQAARSLFDGSLQTQVDVTGLVGAQAGSSHYFQVVYRDSLDTCGETVNQTNAIHVIWVP